MRSTSILSALLITGLSLAVLAAPAYSQSPFPVPGPASLPVEEGREELLRGCNLCHPIMAMLGQQRTEAEWKGVVDAMRGRGAVVTEQEAGRIASYLAKHFAPGMPVRPGAGRMPGGRTFILGGRPPDAEPVVGRALETRDPVGANQKPAFVGQTRAPAIRTRTPVQVTVLARGLNHPWALAFLPRGRMLITEKPGAMRIVSATGEVGAPIAHVPAVLYKSDGGLLDLVLDPKFARNRQLYFAFSEPRAGGSGL